MIAPQQQQQQVSPDRLRERLKQARRTIRKLRSEVTQEREERQRIEGELSDAQAALREIDEKKANQQAVQAKRNPNWSVRSVAACGRKAMRENKKSGAKRSKVLEIVSARPTEGTWLVIGRTLSTYGDEKKQAYFRCWVDKGTVQSFESSI